MLLDLQPSSAVEGRFRSPVAIALIAAAVAALLFRCVSIAEPLGIDQSLWASAVRGMSRGQLLYRDVWEQRPPGIYFIYLAGFNALGWVPSTVAWLDIFAAAATTLLMYALGTTLGGRMAGAAAAALYAGATIPTGLYGHFGLLERSVCETFIAVCIALAAWCAVRFGRRPSPTPAFGVGLFCGAAIVLKPNAGLYLPAILLWTLLYGSANAGARRGSLVRPLAAAALGAAVVPMVTATWLWHLGLLADAKIAVVDFNRYYVAQGFSMGSYALDFSRAVWARMTTNPLWLSGALGALAAVVQLARARRLPPLPGLAAIWGGAAVLVIVVNGARLFNSYFIQAFPPLALMTAWLFTDAGGLARRRGLSVVTGALMVVVTLHGNYASRAFSWLRSDFDLLRGRVDRVSYLQQFGGYENARGYSARANEELADYLRARTRPDERIFLFGINGAGVYFAANRLTAHRFLRVNFFVATDFRDGRFRLDAVVDDLAERRPRYVIFERLHSPTEMGRAVNGLPADPVVTRLLARYRFDTRIEDFTLYSRAD